MSRLSPVEIDDLHESMFSTTPPDFNGMIIFPTKQTIECNNGLLPGGVIYDWIHPLNIRTCSNLGIIEDDISLGVIRSNFFLGKSKYFAISSNLKECTNQSQYFTCHCLVMEKITNNHVGYFGLFEVNVIIPRKREEKMGHRHYSDGDLIYKACGIRYIRVDEDVVDTADAASVLICIMKKAMQLGYVFLFGLDNPSVPRMCDNTLGWTAKTDDKKWRQIESWGNASDLKVIRYNDI